MGFHRKLPCQWRIATCKCVSGPVRYGLTVHSSRRRFAARLNSGVRRLPQMTWYSLASTIDEGDVVVVRFVPGDFVTDSTEPVLVVRVHEPSDRQATLEVLGKMRDSSIVEYTSTPTSFTALLDSDWEESTIRGASVGIFLEPYSTSELLDLAKGFMDQLQAETSRNYAKSRRISEIERFVSDLITRADVKKSQSSRSCSIVDGQIDVLTRVLNRIRDA